jgi:preprotein translocase SecE subunit
MLARVRAWWRSSMTEWREKMEWVPPSQLFGTTVAVLVGSLLLAIVIGLIDLAFSTVMRFLYSFF